MKEISTGGFKIAHILIAAALFAAFIVAIFLITRISVVPYTEKAIVIKKEIYSERIDTKIDSVYNDKGKLIYQGIEELTEGKCYITARSVKDGKRHRIEVSENVFKCYDLKDTTEIIFTDKNRLKYNKNTK